MSRVVGFVPAPPADFAATSTHLVVGHRGEVGNALVTVLAKLFPDRVNGYDVVDQAPDPDPANTLGKYDVLHVCIPYEQGRRGTTTTIEEYRDIVDPSVTIVYSTTPPGTCHALGVVHSPVEGRHRGSGRGSIVDVFRNHPRMLGSADGAQLALAVAVWRTNECEPLVAPSATLTEFLKLRSTFVYGLDIMLAQWTADALFDIDAPEDAAMVYDRWWNEVYAHDETLARSILAAPNGPIGGHCVVPNAAILARHFPHEMLTRLAEWNDAYTPQPDQREDTQ